MIIFSFFWMDITSSPASSFPLPPSFSSFGESLKNRAGYHPGKAAGEGAVIGFSQMRIANPEEELNDFS
jgi:hypothetical protein